MEFVNDFTVPTDVDTTFKTLLDLEKVAPCLPGATLEEVDGDVYTGRVKVKVGPITVSYRGTAEVVDVDEEARTARIDAKGQETRGAGSASADVTAALTETDAGTLVHVVTDLTVTGKPAQFGRGVMGDVGTKIIDQFAERLRAMVTDDSTGADTAASGASPEADGQVTPAADPEVGDTAAVIAPAAPPLAEAGPRKISQDPDRQDDALDLMEVAGAAAARRAIPVAVVAAVAALVWWLVRRR